MHKHTRIVVMAMVCATLFLSDVLAAAEGEFCDASPGSGPGAGKIFQAHPHVGTSGADVWSLRQDQQALFDWLSESFEGAPAIKVQLTGQERSDIGHDECAGCQPAPSERRYLAGVSKPLNQRVDFSRLAAAPRHGQAFANGAFSRSAAGLGWAATLASPDAVAMRVLIRDISLPEDAALFVYNDRGEAFGPYVANESGQVWTNTVSGASINVAVQFFGRAAEGELARSRFEIAEVVHAGPRFLAGGSEMRDLCSNNEPCVEDASCYNSGHFAHIEDARRAAGHMWFVSGPWAYICSGGLIADTDASETPYFLTANHCISKSQEANSLEAYWQYWTSSCGGSCYSPYGGSVPRTLGSSLLATGSSGDYTLLHLNENPPSGSVFMGWTNDSVAFSEGYELYRISHPKGSPQAFSHHTVRTSGPHCTSIPRGAYIYSGDQTGATEGGSSGSPVLNADGQIVGQLYGACGPAPSQVCDLRNSTVDGALAHYFNNVSQWLVGSGGPGDPPGDGTMSVASIELSVRARGPWRNGVAEVTVVDDGGNPVANATVNGTFSGDVSGSVSATTAGNGKATLESDRVRASSISFSFCVTNVSHANLDFEPGNDCGSL